MIKLNSLLICILLIVNLPSRGAVARAYQSVVVRIGKSAETVEKIVLEGIIFHRNQIFWGSFLNPNSSWWYFWPLWRRFSGRGCHKGDLIYCQWSFSGSWKRLREENNGVSWWTAGFRHWFVKERRWFLPNWWPPVQSPRKKNPNLEKTVDLGFLQFLFFEFILW